MELLLQFILLCTGLVLLWKTGEKAVQNAIGFSAIYKIESFTIGFFLFAISTGIPEITSAIVSTIQKVPELSAGDLMGSSFINLSLMLGISIILAGKIEIGAMLRKKLFLTSALMIILFFGVILIPHINTFAGILLIILYFGSALWFQTAIPKKEVSKVLKEAEHAVKEIEKKITIPPKVDILLRLFSSLALLMLSSWLTVYSGAKIANLLQVDTAIIGATFIAVGTGLPELTLEIHAIRKKEYELALGDIFGSSLLNISLVLGMLILINRDIDFSFGKLLLPFFSAAIGLVLFRLIQKKPLIRRDGILSVTFFIFYIGTVILSQIL